MKKILIYAVLPLIIVALCFVIFKSIMKPVSFDKEKSIREAVCVERLKNIRTLQIAYKAKYDRFTSSMDSLINFYKTDSVIVVRQVGSWDDSVAVALKQVYRDSIKLAARDTLLKSSMEPVDSIAYIPFSGGQKMILKAVIGHVSGVNVPLFEASAPYDALLSNLERQLIVNLNADNEVLNRYPGLKVGSIDAPNNNAGNWE